MSIRFLPQTLVNRIAAGEVVERPASVVKELVENALDACASHVKVNIVDGGRALITVTDDGNGMEAGELWMAVERHATSKLPEDDLARVTSLGFRGEALPAICAVARLTLTSRCRGADNAWSLAITASRRGDLVPAAHPPGTRVDVRDLFFAIPARLKFLKGPRAEAYHIRDILGRLALAHPMVGFTLSDNGNSVLNVPAAPDIKHRTARIARLMGRAFVDNAVSVSAEQDGITLGGLIGLPSFTKKSKALQYLFVNGRPIRDRLLGTAIRTAYQNMLSKHEMVPLACLFLTLPPDRIDINVHPAKAEVRFRDAEEVRNLLVIAIRHALAEARHPSHRRFNTVRDENLRESHREWHSNPVAEPSSLPLCSSVKICSTDEESERVSDSGEAPYGQTGGQTGTVSMEENFSEHPLGVARAQIHNTYIIAETPDGVMIVDQHAAHERLIQERLWAACKGPAEQRQSLMKVPEVVTLKKRTIAERLVSRADELRMFGLVIEAFGAESVIVRATPVLLGEIDVRGLIQVLIDGLEKWEAALDLQERLHHICLLMASFYGRSVQKRRGSCLTVFEMNALLRQIEVSLHTAQCAYCRPIYGELNLNDLKKLLHR